GAAAMAHIAVQRFGAGGTQENAAQYPEPFRVVGEQLDGIPGVESLENMQVIGQVGNTQYGQHQEPAKHHRTKQLANGSCSELLHEKQYADKRYYNVNDGFIGYMPDAVDIS